MDARAGRAQGKAFIAPASSLVVEPPPPPCSTTTTAPKTGEIRVKPPQNSVPCPENGFAHRRTDEG